MKNGFALLPLLVIVAVFGLVVAGVAYYSSRANLSSSAKYQESTTRVTGKFPTKTKYQPETNQAEVKTAIVSLQSDAEQGGQSVPVSVSFADPQEVISGVALRLIYNGDSNDGLSVSGIQIAQAILDDGSWMCPIKKSKVVEGQVMVDLACVNISPEGFLATGETQLATFNLMRTNGTFTAPIEMQIDPKLSAIVRKSDGKNVLNISGELMAR